MRLAAPTSIRAIANAFLGWRDDIGIASVLDLFDWTDVSPRQIYYAVLERLPETAQMCTLEPGYHSRELAYNALHSDEFQGRLINLMFQAFPEKRRLIFVHIPKCAGVDLTGHLKDRYPYLSHGLCSPLWTSPTDLFRALHAFATLASNADSVFFGGHFSLPWVLDKRYLRYGDEAFTVVREPGARVLSKVNYVIETLRNEAAPNRPDRMMWLERLGYPTTGEWDPGRPLPELARDILRDDDLVVPNGLCASLGQGDAESSVEAIIRADIEITDVTRYNSWLRTRWGEEPGSRLNPSRPFITYEDLSADDRDYLRSMTEQDYILYDLIMDELNAAGSPSIRGLSLVPRASSLGLAAA